MSGTRKIEDAPRRAAARRSGARGRDASLTARESEILGLLATGLSGADIAAQLVLSPETVRTHVRNAMAKLGASTRSQAVALALQRHQIADGGAAAEVSVASPAAPAPGEAGHERLAAPTAGFTAVPDTPLRAEDLQTVVDGLVGLHEIDAASVYLTDEDGMTLRRAAWGGEPDAGLVGAPEVLALGEGPIGRAALERRAQLVLLSHPALDASPGRGAVVAPMAAGRLVGVLCFTVRASRPAGRGELLLAQAFATRIAEVLSARGGGAAGRLTTAMERFKVSWTATAG